MQCVMPVNILYTYTQHYDTATAVNTLTQSEGINDNDNEFISKLLTYYE